MRRLLGGGIVIAGFACWLMLAGAASARQAGSGDTISVHGLIYGNEKFIYFSFSGSPIREFQLDGGPTLHFTGFSVTDPGRPSRPGVTCTLTPTNFGVACDFGQTTPGDDPRGTANYTGQTPTMVTGSVLFGDGTPATFTAPITTEHGKPAVTRAYAEGMKHGRPQFYFSLSSFQGEAPLTDFTVAFPQGLSLSPSIRTLHEHWNGVSFTCTRQGMHRIGCHTKTPFEFVSPHFGPSTLVEDRALVMKVRENKVKKLPVTVGAKDELLVLTHVHVIAPIKD